VAEACPSDYVEEWDLPRLINEVTQYFPTKFVAEDLDEATTTEQVTESLVTEALELYAERDESLPGGEETARQLERDVMLQIIDQRWRDHLADMDYLREGINLRAMGNQDPLVAWERESFAMFEKLMEGITDDYLRYIFHVQVLTEQAPEPDLGQANYIAADDPVQDAGPMAAALAGQVVMEAEMALSQEPASNGAASDGPATNGRPNRGPETAEIQAPIVKSEHEKLGRNQPCWCGSGKKFKLCHGAN